MQTKGTLVLSKKVIEKFYFYLRPEKILTACGIDPHLAEREIEEIRKKRNARINKT